MWSWATRPRTWSRAAAMCCRFPKQKLLLDMQACINVVRHAGPVGAVGYCWGGTLAYLAACELPVAAAVAYYGTRTLQNLQQAPAGAGAVPLRRTRQDHSARGHREDPRRRSRRASSMSIRPTTASTATSARPSMRRRRSWRASARWQFLAAHLWRAAMPTGEAARQGAILDHAAVQPSPAYAIRPVSHRRAAGQFRHARFARHARACAASCAGCCAIAAPSRCRAPSGAGSSISSSCRCDPRACCPSTAACGPRRARRCCCTRMALRDALRARAGATRMARPWRWNWACCIPRRMWRRDLTRCAPPARSASWCCRCFRSIPAPPMRPPWTRWARRCAAWRYRAGAAFRCPTTPRDAALHRRAGRQRARAPAQQGAGDHLLMTFHGIPAVLSWTGRSLPAQVRGHGARAGRRSWGWPMAPGP